MKKEKKEKQEVKVIDSTGQTKQQNPNIIELSREEPERPFYEITEEERRKLFKVYKSTSIRNNIIMFVVLGAFIGAFIAITRGQIGQIIGWVLIGVTIVSLVTYYLLTRNSYPKASKTYFYTFWKYSSEYLFNQDGFEDCKIDQNDKYEMSELIADRVYKETSDIASRNLVKGTYFGKPFVFGEAALYKPGAKKNSRDVIFVGRHLSVQNKLEFEGRYIVNIKREQKPLDLPNDIEDLSALLDEEAFIIYGPEGRDYKKDLGEDLIKSLKEFKLEEGLANVNIAFWQGRTACYLSYEDSIVAMPFQNEINLKAYESEKKDIEKLFAILAR